MFRASICQSSGVLGFLDFKLPPCSERCFFFFWVIPRRLIYIRRRFGNTLSVLSAFEDGTDRVFRNVGIYKSDAGESPKRKQTTSIRLHTYYATPYGVQH